RRARLGGRGLGDDPRGHRVELHGDRPRLHPVERRLLRVPGGRMIEFRGVKKAFEGRPVLRGLDLDVAKGEGLYIIGTSGVGKSVTIKHVVGLLRPDEGEIWLDGRRIDRLRERDFYPIRMRCGMVFQSSTLFDSLTILENVALPLRKHKHLREAAAEKLAMQFIEMV